MKQSITRCFGIIFGLLFVISAIPLSGNVNTVTLLEQENNAFASATTYDWQTFNKDMNVTAFVSPDGSRDELWHFLNSAEESIYVEIYGINHPHIIDLFHELYDTKPSLDIKFLLGWNSLGYYSENDYVANNLTELGYDVKWTSDPDFTFAHQKFFIIDNETTVIHSGNWAKTSFPEFEFKANREWSIAMTDTDVTDYYRDVFDGDWLNGTWYDAGTHGTGSPLTQPTTTSTYQSPFATAGEFSGPMNVTPILSPDTSLEGILYCINTARYTLDIQIPYFTSIGDGGEVDEVVGAILDAKARGVTVRVISEEEKDWAEIAANLTDHGIPIVWQDTRWFTANHNKGIIVDGRIVLISSINYSDGSIANNREAGVIIEHEGIAQWFLEVYDFDWGMGNCDEMEEVNVYWEPNIPESTDTINITVYAHMLNGSTDLDNVILSVKIDDGTWTNHSILNNIFESSEEDLENYFYEISPQPDGTNITIQAFVNISNVWHTGLNMTIHVTDDVLPQDTADPVIDSPTDIVYELGTEGHNITWTPVETNPKNYSVTIDAQPYVNGTWDGSTIVVDIDGLDIGTYDFEVTVFDDSNNDAKDSVSVEVEDTTAPIISHPDDFNYELGHVQPIFITWTLTDSDPENYTVSRNGTVVTSDDWTGILVFNLNIQGLNKGTYIFVLTAFDQSGNSANDTVIVVVEDTTVPIIDHPSDLSYEYGSTGAILTWVPIDIDPSRYEITRNGVEVDSGWWFGGTISLVVDGLELGSHEFIITVFDISGNSISDSVTVTVTPTSQQTMIIIAIAAVGGIVVLILACIMKKK